MVAPVPEWVVASVPAVVWWRRFLRVVVVAPVPEVGVVAPVPEVGVVAPVPEVGVVAPVPEVVWWRRFLRWCGGAGS